MEATHYSYSTLDASPQYYPEVIKLIESEFNYSSLEQYEIDFAPLMQRENWKHLHIMLGNEGQLIGHVGIKLRKLDQMPIATIGGVAIQKEFQGKGFFKRLMHHVIHHYEEEVGLFLLWSDKSTLYKKFYFYLAIGQAESQGSSSFESLGYQQTKYANLSKTEKHQIQQLYDAFAKKYATLHRDETNWDDIAKITSSDLYILKEDDVITSYFFQNKGQDLKGIIHEYSSMPMYKIFRHLAGAKIWVPERDRDQVETYQLAYMGLVRLGSKEIFKNFIKSWSQNQILIQEIDNLRISFNFSNDKFQMSTEDFLQGLFGPNPVTEFENFGKPIFISGLDSI